MRSDRCGRLQNPRRHGREGAAIEPEGTSMAVTAPPHGGVSSEEEAMILEVVRDLVSEKVAPRAAEIDETRRVPMGHPKDLRRKTICSASRSRRSTAGSAARSSPTSRSSRKSPRRARRASLIIAVQELGALPILIAGTTNRSSATSPNSPAANGSAAYALTEAGSGSDAAGSMRARAVRDGDNYVLNGTKIWITQGQRRRHRHACLR